MNSATDNFPSNTSAMSFAPATESQMEVWISCLLGGEDANRSYNLSVSLTLTGSLNRACFDKNLQQEIDRHESLRSTFTEDGTQVCIYKEKALNLHFEDLSSMDEAKKESCINTFVRKDINTSFDLFKGPLHHLSLFKCNENKHILVFTVHHIVCDGWSMGLFLEELGSNYSACIKGEKSNLAEAISFQKYAFEQKEFSESRAYKEIQDFWIDQFKDYIPVLELPTDFSRPAVRTTKSQRYDFILDPDLLSDIQTLCSKTKCSLAITLRAVFEILLYRLTGQNDIVLGLPTAGQPVTDNYSLMSHCINLLPIRSSLKGDVSFKEYLNQRRSATLDAYDHQQFTYGSLLKKLFIPRDTSRLPLVSVVFSIDMGIGEAVKLIGIDNDLVSNKRDYENFELFVNATNTGKNFVFEWSYNIQLFKPGTIKQMMESFETLLYAVVKEPEIRVKDLLANDPRNESDKLPAWNDTKAIYPRNTLLCTLIAQNALLHPNKTAIQFKDRHITCQELNSRVNQLAGFLIDNKIKTGDKIALMLDRSPEMVMCLLAVMKSGAAYIPIDPAYPKKLIEYMLTDSSVKLLLTSAEYRGDFHFNGIHQIILDDISDQLAHYTTAEPTVEVNGDDLAYVIYTSGSTGQPKGIAIEHHSLTNFLCSMQNEPGISANDKFLALTTISFDISGLELYLPLLAGAELLLTDTDTARDGRELMDLIRKEKVNMMQATPSTWRMILETGWEEKLDLKILCGGEALPQDLAMLLSSRCRELWNMYGPTETTIWSAIKKIVDPKKTITIGHPINNTLIYILDSDLKPVGQGITGEIYIAGDGLAREYLNLPQLSSERFLKNPFSSDPGSRIYRTGDTGKFLPDGEIQCFGRIDNQVKLRGYRIELGAIENALNTLEGIKGSVVMAREDRPGDRRLIAYVIPGERGSSEPSENISLTANQIALWKQSLKELLPVYMIPSDYIPLTKVPLLPNGKINRKILPKPNELIPGRMSNMLPGTDLEKSIAAIWKEFLGVETVGLYDDFFELGGHSLIAVQVMIRLEKDTGYRLPLTTLFNFPTLNLFADVVKGSKLLKPPPGDQNSGETIKIHKNRDKQDIKQDTRNAASVHHIVNGDVQKDRVLPRTDIEKLVANIWAEHLGLESVGVYDDFFELGGHSIIAVQVMARLEKETGNRLPLASLFDHPTVEDMALMLKMDGKSITWDSLVPIRPHGQKMPLYIIHGAGLNVLFFNTLAKNMDAEQPVYGLQAKGLNGIDEPLERIEDMAAYYISEILRQNPSGPYALAGFSFGGIIAFEMAKQLKAMNKEVKMLGMFDTYANQSDRYDGMGKKIYNRSRYLVKQLLYTFTLLREDPKRAIEYKTEAIKRRLIQLYWKMKYGNDQKQEGFFGYSNSIDIKNIQAWEKYIFTPYSGSIELFRAKKRTFYMDDFEYLGWKPLALQGVRIHEISGEHNYIFAPPNDQEFAGILQACLDNSIQSSSR
ncbi:MAG: amino acid adenylation domain-containing protein [Daejeonella sp.]